MGEVWRAKHLSLGSVVALKSLDRRLAETDIGRTRFLREAKAAAALRSPHVIQIHDYGVDGDTPFIAMELLEGRSLDERLSEGPLSPEETMRVVDHVARAISKAHEVGFVHRDLKPANVFITPNEAEASPLLRAFWVMKVLDFGIAKEVEAAEAEAAATGEDRANSPSTATGAVVGTPHYMSPEQARGRPVDARSDLWSLGVMTYECLVGERPFRGGSFGGLVLQICSDPLPVPSEHAKVPAGFDAWFRIALERDPSRRFASAKELGDALRAVLEPSDHAAGEPGSSPPASKPRTTAVEEIPSLAKRAPTKKRIAIGLASALGIAAAVALGAGALTGGTEPSTDHESSAPASTPSSSALSSSAPSFPQTRQVTPRQLTFDGDAFLPSLSPDGRTLYFARRTGPGDIAIASAGPSGAASELYRLSGISGVAAAPDGTSILVVGSDGGDLNAKLEWRVLGQDGRVITRGEGARFGTSWAPDSRSFAAFQSSASKEIVIQSLDGSSRTVVVTGNYQWIYGTHWLQKHDRILVVVRNEALESRILLVPPSGGPATEVAMPLRRWRALAVSDGALFVITQPTPSSDLVRFAFDPERGTVDPKGETLVAGIQASGLTVTRDGTRVVYTVSHQRSNLRMSDDATGSPWRELTRGTKLNKLPQFSPDGRSVAFLRIADQRELAIMPASGDDKDVTILSAPDEEIMSFAWSPDGAELAATVLGTNGKTTGLVRYPSKGGAAREIVTGISFPAEEDTLSWAPGQKLLARVAGNQNYARIDVDTGASSMALQAVDGWVFWAQSDRAGNLAVWRNVASREKRFGAWLLPSVGAPLELAEAGAYPLAFSEDQRSIYLLVRPTKGAARLERIRIGATKTEPVRALDFGNDEVGGVDVTPDGKRVVLSLLEKEEDLFRISLASDH